MLNGHFRNEKVGSGTHSWKFSEAGEGGQMTQEEFLEAEAGMSRSAGVLQHDGHGLDRCASMAEAWHGAVGATRPIPAVDRGAGGPSRR
jgi:dihydroxy-acid dehydratase